MIINEKITVNASHSVSVDNVATPDKTFMANAFPNPFNPRTAIVYSLAEATPVTISVYDMLGRHVTDLYTGIQSAGNYQVYWNGTNAQGMQLSSGSYLIRMETQNLVKTQKVVFMK